MMFYYVSQRFTMFSESRNDRNRPIGNSVTANRLNNLDNAAGIGDNSSEIGNDASGIIDTAAKAIPC